MPSLKRFKFINEVMSYIKFPFDKKKIRTELEAHLEDKIDFYIQNGYDSETAEKMAIADMGDSKEIGKALNKQHNPVIGWVWKVSNVITIIAVILSLYYFIYPLIIDIIVGPHDLVDLIPKENISYSLDINKTIKLDDSQLTFTKVIYEKNDNISILWKYNDKRLRKGICNFNGKAFLINDSLGKICKINRISSTPNSCMITLEDINKNAEYLIFNYDLYNRKYRVEIPLKQVR